MVLMLHITLGLCIQLNQLVFLVYNMLRLDNMKNLPATQKVIIWPVPSILLCKKLQLPHVACVQNVPYKDV